MARPAVRLLLVLVSLFAVANCSDDSDAVQVDGSVDLKIADMAGKDAVVPDQVLPDKLVLDQLVPDQYVPDLLVPDQLVPDQLVPDQMIPDQFVPTCTDKIQNGKETDVDCGGGTCPKCTAGQKCKIASDCKSNWCSSKGECVWPS